MHYPILCARVCQVYDPVASLLALAGNSRDDSEDEEDGDWVIARSEDDDLDKLVLWVEMQAGGDSA